jgi:hypothetical protein
MSEGADDGVDVVVVDERIGEVLLETVIEANCCLRASFSDFNWAMTLSRSICVMMFRVKLST